MSPVGYYPPGTRMPSSGGGSGVLSGLGRGIGAVASFAGPAAILSGAGMISSLIQSSRRNREMARVRGEAMTEHEAVKRRMLKNIRGFEDYVRNFGFDYENPYQDIRNDPQGFLRNLVNPQFATERNQYRVQNRSLREVGSRFGELGSSGALQRARGDLALDRTGRISQILANADSTLNDYLRQANVFDVEMDVQESTARANLETTLTQLKNNFEAFAADNMNTIRMMR